MTDIATLWDVSLGAGDWAISAPSWPLWVDEHGNSIRDQHGRPIGNAFQSATGLVDDQDFYTAVLISLFTDAAASDDDIIPDGSADPRGWWGDASIGSKLWLLSRSKATADIPVRAKTYIAEALQWFIDGGIVASIDITTEWTRPSMLGAQVIFRRQDGASAAISFSRLWDTV